MHPFETRMSPELWLQTRFESKAAARGQVTRQSVRGVQRFAGIAALRAEVARRGYRAVENSGQVVIF